MTSFSLTVCENTPHAEDMRTLFHTINTSFALEPLSVVRNDSTDSTIYRYSFSIWNNAGEGQRLRGIIQMVVNNEGISCAWENVIWESGHRLTPEEAQAALHNAVLHLAASYLYHLSWVAIKAGAVEPRREELHA